MSRESRYARGDAFCARAKDFARPLFLIAHQDDELGYAGLIQRLGSKTRFTWLTNGDGLYFQMGIPPAEYAEIRKKEAVNAVGAIGIPEHHTECLDFSEVEIYRRMAWLYSGEKTMAELHGFFDEIRARVRRVIDEHEPDAVFTCAYQGGQPEHDLTHFFTALALRDLARERGVHIPFFHLPEYEYTILIAMRFHPLYRGTRMRIRLTPEELAGKQRVVEAYPSQKQLFEQFRKVFRNFGVIGMLTGGPTSVEEYMSIEEFGPVPLGFDYARPPHVFDYFSYMFDDFEGTKVTFARSVLPIVRHYLNA